jgi:hypothetical protein
MNHEFDNLKWCLVISIDLNWLWKNKMNNLKNKKIFSTLIKYPKCAFYSMNTIIFSNVTTKEKFFWIIVFLRWLIINIYHSRNRPPPCDVGGLCREKNAPIAIWASDDGEMAKIYFKASKECILSTAFMSYSKPIELIQLFIGFKYCRDYINIIFHLVYC